MPHNSIINESNVESLIPEDVAAEILLDVPLMNPVLNMARRLPNMSVNQRRTPVLSTLATAYFVSGRTGLKQTTDVSWEDKYIEAEELAVIVPIPQSVLDDVHYDIWGNVKPELKKALSIAITNAILYGTNIPASWTTNLGAAGLIAYCGSGLSIAAYDDLYTAILGETTGGTLGLFGTIEDKGFLVTGNIAHVSMKTKLRNLRDTLGQPIFKSSVQGVSPYELDGTPMVFPTDGTMNSTYKMISGEWDKLVYAIRQDITYTIGTEAIIQDSSGAIVYNLFQQDMVALRAVIRLGVALPNPINRMDETEATRKMFNYLKA